LVALSALVAIVLQARLRESINESQPDWLSCKRQQLEKVDEQAAMVGARTAYPTLA